MVIAAGKFKTHCLELMDQVNLTHEEITIQKRGRPVARLIPIEPVSNADIIGTMSDTATMKDDLIAPTGALWHADT